MISVFEYRREALGFMVWAKRPRFVAQRPKEHKQGHRSANLSASSFLPVAQSVAALFLLLGRAGDLRDRASHEWSCRV